MNFVDFHCHLDMEDFAGKREEIIKECFASGFSKLVTVADPYEKDSLRITTEILGYHKNIFCTAAAHPHNADKYSPQVEKDLLQFLKNKDFEEKVLAVGEAGLDYHYNFSTPENQQRVFKRQIAIAKELRLPLIIHSRQAEKETLNILEKTKFSRPVVFHCYTGTIEDAREILKRGYYISISGIVTFKKSEFLREIVEIIPLSKIFTETDSPYLSPQPFRGRLNTPLRVKLVAEKIAEVKGVPLEKLNKAVNSNFRKLLKNT
ncbi:MAG: TatD family hydrolase [Candidatus Aminicenantes bacterium]|nr:TatD family hydrolase [Candidatus Aminicenantes bacterium]